MSQGESLSPLRARTITPTGDGVFVRLRGWEKQGPLFLVLYATTATDGLVWVSTEADHGAANTVAAVPDRRPLTPPCTFYVGPYTQIAVATTTGEEGATITLEMTPHPVAPVRQAVDPARPARCET